MHLLLQLVLSRYQNFDFDTNTKFSKAATTNQLNRLKSINKSVGNEFHYRFVVSRDYYATQYVAEMFEYKKSLVERGAEVEERPSERRC